MALGSLPVHNRKGSMRSLRSIRVKLMTSAGTEQFANDFEIDIDHLKNMTEPQRELMAGRIVDTLVGHMSRQWRVALDGQ